MRRPAHSQTLSLTWPQLAIQGSARWGGGAGLRRTGPERGATSSEIASASMACAPHDGQAIGSGREW